MKIELIETFPSMKQKEFRMERPLTGDEASNLFAAVGFPRLQCARFSGGMAYPNLAVVTNRGAEANTLYMTDAKSIEYLVLEFIDSLPSLSGVLLETHSVE